MILKENFVDRKVEYFDSYVKQYTDLGMLITLVEHPDGHGLTAAKFLTAADLDPALFDLATTVLQPEETAVPRLPAVIDSLTVHAPFGREVLGRLTVSGSRDDPTLRADIKLCDPQGAVLLEARGFTMRSLETTQRSVSLGEHDPRLKPGEGLAPFEGGRLFRLVADPALWLAFADGARRDSSAAVRAVASSSGELV